MIESLKERVFGNLIMTGLGLLVSGLAFVGNRLQANPSPLVYGLAGVVGALGLYLRDPAVAKAIVAFIVAKLVKPADTKVDPPAPPAPPSAPVAIFFALALGALLAARPASAQDVPPAPEPAPAPAVSIFGFYPTLGFTGSAFDFAHNAGPVRSVQVGGLLEREVWKDKLGLAAGLQFQTGDIQGLNATGLVTFPMLVPKGSKFVPAAGATGAFVLNQRTSVSAVAGTLMRF